VVVGGIELSGMSTSVVDAAAAAARGRGREALPLGAARLVHVHVRVDDAGRDIGMTCGGIVRVYFEAFNVTRWNIVVFGAGHVAHAVIDLLKSRSTAASPASIRARNGWRACRNRRSSRRC
jgi:xanthine/CO dehydrogenase XdhC/CoxF family maturation factor